MLHGTFRSLEGANRRFFFVQKNFRELPLLPQFLGSKLLKLGPSSSHGQASNIRCVLSPFCCHLKIRLRWKWLLLNFWWKWLWILWTKWCLDSWALVISPMKMNLDFINKSKVRYIFALLRIHFFVNLIIYFSLD